MRDSFPPLDRRRALLYAALLGLGVMWITGAIPRWGQWYSEHPFYRAQVYAFFHGRLALTDRIDGVTHDLAWIEGGVQQVWGLGVPLWLSLWELVGRVIHVTPFPDRVAMLLGAILMMYVLLRTWFGPGGDRSYASRGAFLFTALMPGVITMLRGRAAVYEEAAAYAYGASMLLFAGLMMMIRRPSRARYVLLLAFAGATGLLRPTVWFYGAVCAACATVLYVRHCGTLRRALPAVALGGALFVAGGGALYVTNYLRFGSGGEFGHRLNLEDLPGNLYATRFNYPFETVPTTDAAKELVGAMFGEPEKKARTGYFFYERKLHRGELEVPRWREYYFTPYRWSYLALSLVGLGCVALAWLRLRRRASAPTPAPISGPGSATRPDLDRETRWIGLWAVLAGAPLLVFYLRSPSVSSRYFLDVAPTIGVLMITAWRYLASRLGPMIGAGAFAALALWWGFATVGFTIRRIWLSPVRAQAAYASMVRQVAPQQWDHEFPDAYDLSDPWLGRYIGADQWECLCFVDLHGEQACDHSAFPVKIDLERKAGDDENRTIVKRIEPEVERVSRSGGPWPVACSLDAPDPRPPEAAPPEGPELVTMQPPPTLYRNGTNWDLTTGAIAVATYFFVDDPEYVEVEVAPIHGEAGPGFVPAVRAKVQLEELRFVDATSTPRGVRMRFAGPRTARYRRGVQIVFLAFGGPEQLDQPVSDYTLLRVAWRDPR